MRVALLLPLALSACWPFAERPPVPASFPRIAEARRCLEPEGANELVIRSSEQWLALEREPTCWKYVSANGVPSPGVDFATHDLILVAAGMRANGCFDAQITGVTETGSEVRVEYTETVPGGDCRCTAAISYPHDLIVVPKVSKPVRFEKKVFKKSCGSS